MDFDEPEVIVNLTDCTIIRPPAILWCAVFLLLAENRGSHCSVKFPKDPAVSGYLQSSGLDQILQDKEINLQTFGPNGCHSADIVLPLTRFDSTTEAEDLTNQIHYKLSESGKGSVNVYEVVYETFSELANNAAEHSSSQIGSYGFVQFNVTGRGSRFVCAVADGGVGIKTSLLRNPFHEKYGHYEWEAMERATEELVSGTSDSYRGIGLYETVSKMRIPGRELIIHSGTGIMNKGEKLTTRINGTQLFPGTMVYISVPT